MARYSVKDVARLLGLTPGAMHYFEKESVMNVKKDENGHRYYEAPDLFRVLSYVKYRSMGFPMKTIITQFNGEKNGKDIIRGRLMEHKLEAGKKAAYYRELEQAIDAHIESAENIERLLGQYEFAKSPKILAVCYSESGWTSKSSRLQLLAQKWIEAMPVSRLAVILNSIEPMDACLGYAIAPEKAAGYGLPAEEEVRELGGESCLHTVVASTEEFTYKPHLVFEKPLEYARLRGLEPSGTPWAYIVLVETTEKGELVPYVEVWLPIK